MLKTNKSQFIANMQKIYSDMKCIIIIRYQGLTVADLTLLRNSLRKEKTKIKIIHNKLSKIAALNSNFIHNESFFSGATAVVYSQESLSPIKTVVDLSKDFQFLKIVSAVIDSEIFNPTEIMEIAKLPSLDVLRARISNLLKLPAVQLINVIKTPYSNIAKLCKLYSEKS
ncbi:50S ribosomal protein L10 [Rickettsia endosymbiont of Cardiosporidium cionae]|uniref:50S ribosomal protein L10 n=1 Tax=Rickettsia endosymbiont of Cardiosporidium cionae TaxID=2777155 RepID=UPI00226BCA39|nr:50S ribosomal protein L10 [Rickettsia endosymbiont of Cardiosporidium cionae]KAF8818629.1 50S ribosomal protein L10 [Rickettsia endosymbiont of Cardiosporidium cionae]